VVSHQRADSGPAAGARRAPEPPHGERGAEIGETEPVGERPLGGVPATRLASEDVARTGGVQRVDGQRRRHACSPVLPSIAMAPSLPQ